MVKETAELETINFRRKKVNAGVNKCVTVKSINKVTDGYKISLPVKKKPKSRFPFKYTICKINTWQSIL